MTSSVTAPNPLQTSSTNDIPPPIQPGKSVGEGQPTVDMSHSGGETNLIKQNYTPRVAQKLQDTYLFNKSDVEHLAAFAEAVAVNPKLRVNTEDSGFLQKLKVLCAKLMRFFGNERKAVQLQGEGIAAFNEIKDYLLAPSNRKSTLQFIKDNKNNSNVLKGFCRILSLKEDDAQPEKLEAFINIKFFKEMEPPERKDIFLREIFKESTDSSLAPETCKNKLQALSDATKGDPGDGSLYFANRIFKRAVAGEAFDTLAKELNEAALFNRLQEKMPDGGPELKNSKELLAYFKEHNACDLLVDPQLLKDFPEVKTFLEQEALPMTKDEVQAELTKVLGESRRNKKDWTDEFSSKNQIFLDMDRNYTIEFYVDGNPLNFEAPQTGLGSGKDPFDKLDKAIKSLTPEQQERVQEFCKNFSTQGVFALRQPRFGAYGRIDGDEVFLKVDISEERIHVVLDSTKSVNDCKYWHKEIGTQTITAHTETPVCKFEFDYNPEDGSATNVNMVAYSGQTVNIIAGSTPQEPIITF